jgi:hypothetical protein
MKIPKSTSSPAQLDLSGFSLEAASVPEIPMPIVPEKKHQRPTTPVNDKPKQAAPSNGESATTGKVPKPGAKSDAEKQADRRALNFDRGLKRVEFWISEACKLRIEAAAKAKKKTSSELAAATLEKAFP